MQFGILGPLLVRSEGRLTEVPAAKQRVLLAHLLTRANQVVPAETLAETVWDGSPPRGAMSTLRTYVMRLRRVLGTAAAGRIVTHHPGYRVSIGSSELDLLRFDVLCREGRAAMDAGYWPRASHLLGEALGLWRGIPLVDVPSRLLQHLEVPQLEQSRLQALEWRIDADLHGGRHGELVAELQALVAEHPLHERFHAQLMLALYRCSRRGEALAAYRQARRMLVGELGIEPGQDLRDLQQRILTGDPEPTDDGRPGPDTGQARRICPRQLPMDVRHFVGRRDELGRLSALLDQAGGAGNRAPVISVIGGMAGAGKTALAVHWAHQVADRFPDGQMHVNLHGFGPTGRPLSAAEAIRHFLEALGVPAPRIPADLPARTAFYRSLLAGRRVLILLDNAQDTEQVRPLLPGHPGSLILVTSRRQLTGLAAAEGAALLTLDVLSPAEAGQMLAACLGARRAAAEPAAVSQLIALCDRLPLALAAVAARAAARPTHSLATLAAELRDTATRLDNLDTEDAATSVRTSFHWSYRQLGREAARMFCLLGTHPGPDISLPAAARAADRPVARARQTLRELVDAHLLAEHDPGHFTYHGLLRAYAANPRVQRHAEQPARRAGRTPRAVVPRSAAEVA